MPGAKPGIDKPTGRVIALIVLMIFVAAALRGYLPAQDHTAHSGLGSNRAAMAFVIAVLSATIALLAVAVIARLRDPRAVAPSVADPELLGTGKGRPNWRVILIGLALIIAWLLIVALLVRISVPHGVAPAAPTQAPTDPPAGQRPGTPPQQHPQNNAGDTFKILLASTIAMVLIIVTGSVILSRRRLRATTARTGTLADDHHESPTPPPSESLVRAAESGLAEIGDLNREPREAIIACYAAMERELANFPGAAPQDFDTPTEVLVRAVELHALREDNAAQLVNLFEEARFSPHVMNEEHRKTAVDVLRLVLAELRSPV